MALIPMLWLSAEALIPEKRVVRIGVNQSPPYVLIGADGSLSGFTVEVLREAARRRGISLQWIVAPEGPDVALRSGKVDIWHLYTDLPERHRYAYFSDPWMRIKFALVVPQLSPIQTLQNAAGHRISYTSSAIETRLAHQLFLPSALVPAQLGHELERVCSGQADAALIEMKTMTARLLHPTPGCGTLALRLVPVPGASYRMAIGATRGGLAAAKELRSEIGRMAQDGTLDRLHQRWFQFTTDETRIVSDLIESERRSRLFFWGAVILAGVVMLLGVLIRRERLAQQFTKAVLDTAGGLMLISDSRGRIVRFNRACERAAGRTLHDLRGKPVWEVLVPPDERDSVQSMFTQLADGKAHQSSEYHWHTPDGERLFSWSNTVLVNRAGRVDYIIGNGIDISAREAAEEKLGYEANHDPLTNLANRRELLRGMWQIIGEIRGSGTHFSVAIADLDHFKMVNDTYGHEAGDEVLIHFAEILRSELAPGDLAGRLGGDEFCLVIGKCDVGEAVNRIARRLQAHEFRTAKGASFHVAATFGVACWGDAMCQPADLLRAADQALYQAKRCRPTGNLRFIAEMEALGGKLDADRVSAIPTEAQK